MAIVASRRGTQTTNNNKGKLVAPVLSAAEIKRVRDGMDAALNGKGKIIANDPVAKLVRVQEWVAQHVVGREDVTRAIMLSIVARANCLFIGPPGTAKTLAVELTARAFCDKPGDVFHTMLTKFSKRDEVMGPPDIKALESGEVSYRTEGFLPRAKVGVIDEVFKGSSAILNSLLTIANERRFQNGARWEDTPTRMLVGMSNEFPEEPALLAAFFDRFPVKLMVGYLDNDQFTDMLAIVSAGAGTAQPPCTISDADFGEIDKRVSAVVVTPEIIKAITEIRHNLKQTNVTVSDRRWVQCLRLMRANAVLDGRSQLVRKDMRVFELVCWNQESDRAAIKAMLPDFENPFERELRNVTDEVYAEREKLLAALNVGDRKDASRNSPDTSAGVNEAAKTIGRINQIGAKLEAIDDMIESDDDRVLLAEAKLSIQTITELVTQLVRGKDVASKLLATLDNDI